MELVIDYIVRGVLAVFFDADGALIWMPLIMIFSGIVLGIVVGATPGLNGPFAMAISLPILVSVFGTGNDDLLTVLAFLIGLMKGSTLGGAVPAILFNTPGTPDAYLTTLDGYPMAQKGQGRKALKIAHFSSVTGDTFSDMVLFVAAPTAAILIERVLDYPEKAALIILSLSFMAAVAGRSVVKGLLAGGLGMFLALVGSTISGLGPRLDLGVNALGSGIPMTSAVLGVLVVGAILADMEDRIRSRRKSEAPRIATESTDDSFGWADIRKLMPTIGRSAVIGTVVGALPGIGTTIAATLGYHAASRRPPSGPAFGEGAPEGVAATEAANSSVSGANLIPVMSLGIPGNFAAAFLILAVESVGDFTFGPQVFRFTEIREIEDYGIIINDELVIAFGIFTLMVLGNVFNWTVGRSLVLSLGVLARIPATLVPGLVLMITVTAVYAQDGGLTGIVTTLVFGLIGYVLNRLQISLLPFVIGFILSPKLEEMMLSAFSASGGDALFLVKSPISIVFLALSVWIVASAIFKKEENR